MSIKKLKWMPLVIGLAAGIAACGDQTATPEATETAAPADKLLGIRPSGDETVQIDMSKIKNPDLPKIFANIDENIDQHVINLQKWIQQPTVSNTGEGIPESAEMVKGFFDRLGCQESRIDDSGINQWGSQSNPVVFARCDEGAEKTLADYWQGDTMPVSQPDLWKAPPFEGGWSSRRRSGRC